MLLVSITFLYLITFWMLGFVFIFFDFFFKRTVSVYTRSANSHY